MPDTVKYTPEEIYQFRLSQHVPKMVVYTSVCIGCGDRFQNIRHVDEDEEMFPACDECIETFECEDGRDD